MKPLWTHYLPAQLKPPGAEPRFQPVHCSASDTTEQSGASDSPQTAVSKPCPLPVPAIDFIDLVGHVWRLSQQTVGCRQVQRALEQAPGDALREALVSELRGHVLEACRDPHANFVLQKCIATLPCTSLQFIVDELVVGNVAQIARHKYGCRIIQRLVEFCPNAQVRELVEPLLDNIFQLSRHIYGNYTIQIVLQHGTDEERALVVQVLMETVRQVAAECHGCSVLSCAMTYGTDAQRAQLAQVILSEPGLLPFMAASRHGYVATLRALDVLQGYELEEAVSQLMRESATLTMSKYGTEVLQKSSAIAAERAFAQ